MSASKEGIWCRLGADACATTRGVARDSGSELLVPIRLSSTAPKTRSDAPCFFSSIRAEGLVAKSVLDIWISRTMMLSGRPAFIILAMSALVSTLSVGACATRGIASEKANRQMKWNKRAPRMCGASLATKRRGLEQFQSGFTLGSAGLQARVRTARAIRFFFLLLDAGLKARTTRAT